MDQAVDEGITDAALARPLAIVDIEVGGLSCVSKRRVDELVEAHNKLDLRLYRALRVVDES